MEVQFVNAPRFGISIGIPVGTPKCNYKIGSMLQLQLPAHDIGLYRSFTSQIIVALEVLTR